VNLRPKKSKALIYVFILLVFISVYIEGKTRTIP